MKKIIGLLCILVLGSSVNATETGPEQLIKTTADRVLGKIKTNATMYREDPRKLYALVDEVVLPHFDFVAMTDLALGRYKNKVDATQKPLITNEFRVLLVRTYGKALLEYNDQTIVYLPMEGSETEGDVTVRTEIAQAGGFPIPLNYRLKQNDDGWKVYDISVDDISLVTNYRSSFARQIKKNGVEGLVEVLKTRNREE
ncbi:MAG: ABC transporter substrate-binding protein [Gammaproteobacteria bacterium]|nr:ABC transporter substrate-binding protein [Gammaproteobacteria bacterium]